VADLFEPLSVRRPAKSAAAFRTISEVADDLAVPQHVLRFWESKFSQVRPLKRGGGRRYYRPEDVTLLRRIRQCLYEQGYTIKGVQRLLREGTIKTGAPPPAPPADSTLAKEEAVKPSPAEAPRASDSSDSELRAALGDLRDELRDISELLRHARAKSD
jgi:DNA-binding transcriptional MerR regulator